MKKLDMIDLKPVVIFILIACPWAIRAFPSGATVEACESLLPRHVHTSSKNASESPFFFYASRSRYYPDSKRRKIKVRIGGAPFRGFFVVAMDADTHERVGSFLDARGLASVPCSAATHTDGRTKVGATLVWHPPENSKKGNVIFLGTVLESFSSYYSGLLASVPQKKKKKVKDKVKEKESSHNITFQETS